jgi:hypothetical protein
MEALPDSLELPVGFLRQFFERAQQEAQRTKALLLEQEQKLNNIHDAQSCVQMFEPGGSACFY